MADRIWKASPAEVSDLIARRDGVVVLLEDSPQVWTVLARSVQGNLPSPDPQDAFEIQ